MFSKSRSVFTRAGLACVALWALSGCAALQPNGGEQWQESQRPVLAARAEARWGALIKGDIENAYMYTTPEYRAVVNLQQYKGKYGRVLDWRGARVVDISYDVPTVATVSVEVTYRVDLPGAGGELIETQKTISEKWMYKNREWWYTSN
ncbi:MAG: hypothetical protein ACYCWB_07885 [Thiobacillus sp.]